MTWFQWVEQVSPETFVQHMTSIGRDQLAAQRKKRLSDPSADGSSNGVAAFEGNAVAEDMEVELMHVRERILALLEELRGHSTISAFMYVTYQSL